MMKNLVFSLVFVSLLAACSPGKYATHNKAYTKKAKQETQLLQKSPKQFILPDSITQPPQQVGAINFNLRKPNLVVLHHTAQNSCTSTIETFLNKEKQVSAHYVICREGEVYQMLNDYLRGWHAGVGSWGSVTDINSSSIGIELDNNGSEPFPEVQIQSLKKLLLLLKAQYNIPTQNFIAHSDLAPGRKVDPSVYFPWKELASSGIGIWYDTTNIRIPDTFDNATALKIIGYSVKDLPAAIQSFRLRFLGSENKGVMDDHERKILYALMLTMMKL